MALQVGTVTVNHDLTWTGSGLALALFEQEAPKINQGFADARGRQLALTSLGEAQVAQNLRDIAHQHFMELKYAAAEATQLAAVLIAYFTANTEVTVTVTTSDAGLQRTPDPNDPGAATLAPATAKSLAGAIE